MSNYRSFSHTGTKAVFIAPNDSAQRMTLKVINAPKKVSGISLMNRRVEILVSRGIDPRGRDCKDCTPVSEPLSATLVLSGSTTDVSGKTLRAMKDDIIAAVNAKWDDLVTIGMAPNDATGLVFTETE